jgi:hypothetical protein
MPFTRGLAGALLLVTAAIAGVVDASARNGLIGRGGAAALILMSLLLMFFFAGAASRDHTALAINAMLATACIAIAYAVFTALAGR